MKTISVDNNNLNKCDLEYAGSLINCGKLVVIPTETVYGIALNAENLEVKERLYHIKNRDHNKPLSYHFHSLESFFNFAGYGINSEQKNIFKKLIPNPVTLVYYDSIRKLKIGVRFPENKIAKLIIEYAKCDVFATSANFSGEPSPSTVTEISDKLLSLVDLIIDAGKTDNMMESTVIDISSGTLNILRQGAYKI